MGVFGIELNVLLHLCSNDNVHNTSFSTRLQKASSDSNNRSVNKKKTQINNNHRFNKSLLRIEPRLRTLEKTNEKNHEAHRESQQPTYYVMWGRVPASERKRKGTHDDEEPRRVSTHLRANYTGGRRRGNPEQLKPERCSPEALRDCKQFKRLAPPPHRRSSCMRGTLRRLTLTWFRFLLALAGNMARESIDSRHFFVCIGPYWSRKGALGSAGEWNNDVLLRCVNFGGAGRIEMWAREWLWGIFV